MNLHCRCRSLRLFHLNPPRCLEMCCLVEDYSHPAHKRTVKMHLYLGAPQVAAAAFPPSLALKYILLFFRKDQILAQICIDYGM